MSGRPGPTAAWPPTWDHRADPRVPLAELTAPPKSTSPGSTGSAPAPAIPDRQLPEADAAS